MENGIFICEDVKIDGGQHGTRSTVLVGVLTDHMCLQPPGWNTYAQSGTFLAVVYLSWVSIDHVHTVHTVTL